jgi:hypothetical protein
MAPHTPAVLHMPAPGARRSLDRLGQVLPHRVMAPGVLHTPGALHMPGALHTLGAARRRGWAREPRKLGRHTGAPHRTRDTRGTLAKITAPTEFVGLLDA